MAVKRIKLDVGTVYQKEEGGIYFFRYQINGARKAISLKTHNQKEAIEEAKKQIPLLKATSYGKFFNNFIHAYASEAAPFV